MAIGWAAATRGNREETAMWRQVYVRLRSLWRWRRQEAELDEEIGFHLAEETDERIGRGCRRRTRDWPRGATSATSRASAS